MQLVLELFPGAGLFGRAFEKEGFCVVNGPDLLMGRDVKDFHLPSGRFDGIIGGPPCQKFSKASHMNGTNAVNLIPEFLRLVEEAQPCWAIMENVWGARHTAPDWPCVRFSDADVGGHTKRVRVFWFYGIPPAPQPPIDREARRSAEYSVLASSWKSRQGKKKKWIEKNKTYPRRTAEEAAQLQGFEGVHEVIWEAMPTGGMTKGSLNTLAVHLMGNGVPLAMGRYIAKYVKTVVA